MTTKLTTKLKKECIFEMVFKIENGKTSKKCCQLPQSARNEGIFEGIFEKILSSLQTLKSRAFLAF